VGVQADPLKPAPVGIRPEWYFLFLFQALKLLPGAVGVLVFAAGAVLLLALPFLDRNAQRGEKGPVLTAVYAALVAAAAVLQAMAWLAPAVSHPPEQAGAGGAVVAGRLVSLVFFWLVLGFMVYYLRRLLAENTRLRRLRS
jgi:quinol-cytochrome oxidoreductase complex cytochrome b subunit